VHISESTRTGIAMAVLTAACFVSVTSEYLPVALLPHLASGLQVSDSAVGLLVTGYAVAVAVSVVPLVAVTAHRDRRTIALVSIAAITASNVVLALAPGYGVAIAARLVSAAGHGVFWSVVASMAARLLGPHRAGRATAVVFAGNSLAFVFGMPLCSWLGATIGWRPTAIVVAGAAALVALAIRVAVDPTEAEPRAAEPPVAERGLAAVRRVVADRKLAAVNLVTVLVVLGHFTAFTYITVIIADYVHLAGSSTSGLLFAHGTAGLVGLVLVGQQVDRYPRATALVVAGGLAACMLALLAAGQGSPVVAGVLVVLWAVPAGGLAVVLQAGVLRVAPHRPDLATSIYIVAFQIGIGLGAALGGVLADGGALPAVLAVAAGCGLLAAIVVHRSAGFRAPDPIHRERSR
jgi:predicted MFS family arabinose efflux permease